MNPFDNASEHFKKLNQHIFDDNKTDAQLQSPKSERDQTPALVSAISGEDKISGRIITRFVGYRVRPLDPDNFAGGCKDLLDGLRHAGLIHGDEPWRIRFETEQIKVAHRKDEKTEIVLIYPD